MENSYILGKKAQAYEKEHKYGEAAKIYLKAAQIDKKNRNIRFASLKFSSAATCLYYIGELDEALKYYREALEIAEQLSDLKSDLKGKAADLNNIGLILSDKGDLDGALKHYKEALEIAEQLGDLKTKAVLLNNIGSILYGRGELDEALNYYRKALEIDEQLGDLKGKAKRLNNIGLLLKDRGDLDEALKYYREALEITEHLGDLKTKAVLLNNIGLILDGRGELDEALKYYREALEIAEQLGDLKGKAADLNNIGRILYGRGELDEALNYYRKALEIAEQLGDLKTQATILNNIGGILYDRGELDEALKYYREGLEIDEHLGDLKGKATRLNNIGLLLKGRGELDEALKYYREALDLIQKQIKGKELDFKIGQIPCPNPNCQNNIQIKYVGELAAFIEACPICMVQFSFWMVDPNSSKCIINVLSEKTLKQRKVVSENVNLREQAGIETQTTISEWLHEGAITTSNIANCFKKKGDLLNACNHYFQAASMYMGLGFLEVSENELKSLESLLPDISTDVREKFSHNIAQLRKATSESLRSREFTYMFVSCPNCNREHQIRASATTVAMELCSKCHTKFSVFYNDETQEFYTNILKKSKTRAFTRPKMMERDEIKFCARCGFEVGIITNYCPRCGLHIIREKFKRVVEPQIKKEEIKDTHHVLNRKQDRIPKNEPLSYFKNLKPPSKSKKK